jgi:hypothetical protein
MIDVVQAAKTAHEVNRAYCQAIGDDSQKPWDECPEWQKKSSCDGVMFLGDNPEAGPAECHDNWVAHKIEAGWRYGPEKNEEFKTHPCVLPYDALPKIQQLKDALFHAVVRSML